MATSAVARETVCVLRRKIAKLEGRPAERLDGPEDGPGADPAPAFLSTGAPRLDAVLGGGLPRAGLTEIHGLATRDAGAAAGFALALALLAVKETVSAPLLWIATDEAFAEAGAPYAPGILHPFGIAPGSLLVARARRLEDALWIAEEAAALTALAAVLLEVRSPSRGLDLTATRRLHHRAQGARRPLYLVRQAGLPEPTAAPVRLVVSPAPAGERFTLSGPLAGSLGPPAFTVTVSRSRTVVPAPFTLEWNRDERAFAERHASAAGAQDHGAVVPLSAGGAHHAGAAGSLLALRRSA